jgi:hypothetical protein
MINGTPKFSALAVGEFTVNLLGTAPKMEAKAAFVNPRTGATHGWTTGNVWSPATVAKMRELVELMELDLSQQHFDGGDTVTGVTDPTVKPGLGGGGLGEHLGSDGDQV